MLNHGGMKTNDLAAVANSSSLCWSAKVCMHKRLVWLIPRRKGRSRISGRHHLQCSGSGCCRDSWSSTRQRLSDASGRQVSPAARQQEPQSSAGAPGADHEERSRGHGQWVTKGENLSLQDGRCSKTGGEEKRKRATQTEFIVDATMQPIIARMMVTSEFSIWSFW